MRGRSLTGAMLVAAGLAAWPAAVLGAPVSGRHATVDQRWTTTKPHTPTGSSFTGTYRADGNPDRDPPYMRGMTFYLPKGMRYDTSVPARCDASDLELQLQGSAACPDGSQLGSGSVETKFMGFPSTLQVDVFNNTNEMIMLAQSPLLTTVNRGTIATDGSIAFRSPTCFPSLQPVGCPVDTALQLGSSVKMPAYVSSSGGVQRAYATTPNCPKTREWRTRVRFWWADGSEEILTSAHPCTRPEPRHKRRKARTRVKRR